jgi:hypothetical protein
MIELVVVYCLAADSTHCVEKRDPATSYGDPVACMMSAQLSAQAYLAEHPKWHAEASASVIGRAYASCCAAI